MGRVLEAHIGEPATSHNPGDRNRINDSSKEYGKHNIRLIGRTLWKLHQRDWITEHSLHQERYIIVVDLVLIVYYEFMVSNQSAESVPNQVDAEALERDNDEAERNKLPHEQRWLVFGSALAAVDQHEEPEHAQDIVIRDKNGPHDF